MPFIKHHKEPDKRLRTKPKRKNWMEGCIGLQKRGYSRPPAAALNDIVC